MNGSSSARLCFFVGVWHNGREWWDSTQGGVLFAPPAFHNGLPGESSGPLHREGLRWERRPHNLPGAVCGGKTLEVSKVEHSTSIADGVWGEFKGVSKARDITRELKGVGRWRWKCGESTLGTLVVEVINTKLARAMRAWALRCPCCWSSVFWG